MYLKQVPSKQVPASDLVATTRNSWPSEVVIVWFFLNYQKIYFQWDLNWP